MQLLEEKTQHAEFSMEKHVPVVEKTEKGIKVSSWIYPSPNGRGSLYRIHRNYYKRRKGG